MYKRAWPDNLIIPVNWVAPITPPYFEVTIIPSMPIIPREATKAVGSNDAELLFACINRRTRELKREKPFKHVVFSSDDALFQVSVNYIHRILCFDLCDFRPWNGFPCTADWLLRTFYRRKMSNAFLPTKDLLDKVIRAVESTIPKDQHQGALRWGYALNLLAKHREDQQHA
jgi:hypothetical protein